MQDIRNSLKSLMWRAAGVRREGRKLSEASETIDGWCHYVLPRQFTDPAGWELQNMLTVARVMIAAALRREESRGVHLRSDFPEQDDQTWQRRLGTVRAPASEPRRPRLQHGENSWPPSNRPQSCCVACWYRQGGAPAITFRTYLEPG